MVKSTFYIRKYSLYNSSMSIQIYFIIIDFNKVLVLEVIVVLINVLKMD